LAELKLNPEIRARALEQIGRRMRIHFDWSPNDPKNDEKALRIFRREIKIVRGYHRLHRWDNLPREEAEETHPIDDEIREALEWQNLSTLKMIKHEHEMTLISCFLAIGVERAVAESLVEYIIAKDKASEESE